MKQKNLLFIFGTRPEAIKLAPLIIEFKKYPNQYTTKICVTGQHQKILYDVLDFFSIVPDFDLNIMKHNQSLFDITSDGLRLIENVLNQYEADIIFVQGDTTSAFIGALAGFYKKIKVAHIEAGLRSGNNYSPYPEEINRKLIGHIADYHFAPTEKAKQNLFNENIKENVFIVKNTVIDALLIAMAIIKKQGDEKYYKHFNFIDFSKRIILVTGHRRENFGKPFEDICNALYSISEEFNDVELVYPVHLNPNVIKPVTEILSNKDRIHLIGPLNYSNLVWLMSKSYIVLTDSGGVQEEAPSLGKPVLVMRETTERPEGVESGNARLVGTNKNNIINSVSLLLSDKKEYEKMAMVNNPYGDGFASKRIVEIINKIDYDK